MSLASIQCWERTRQPQILYMSCGGLFLASKLHLIDYQFVEEWSQPSGSVFLCKILSLATWLGWIYRGVYRIGSSHFLSHVCSLSLLPSLTASFIIFCLSLPPHPTSLSWFLSPLVHHYTQSLSLTSPCKLTCLPSLPCLSSVLYCFQILISVGLFPCIHRWAFLAENRLVHWDFFKQLHQTAVRGDLSHQQWSVYVPCLYVSAGQRVWLKETDRNYEKKMKGLRGKAESAVWCLVVQCCHRLNLVLWFLHLRNVPVHMYI